MHLHNAIEEATNDVRNGREKRSKTVKEIQKIKERLFFPVKERILEGKIAGTDSGFASQEMHSLNLILIRSSGVMFEYSKGIMQKSFYYPQSFQFPEPYINTQALERDEFGVSVSLNRLIRETETAIGTIKEFAPKYCFIDGSIVPQHADKPRASSKVKNLYNKTIQSFQKLYQTAEEEKCKIIGCVEDSRGTRFREIVSELVPIKEEYYDTVLLNDLLEKGERTFPFSYTKNPKEHPILNDFEEEYAKQVNAFYLKPTKFDVPLRAEFLSRKPEKEVEEVAEIVYAQSSMHKEYAYPAVLIEADLRARLKREEISMVCDRIVDRIGQENFILQRRNRRPF